MSAAIEISGLKVAYERGVEILRGIDLRGEADAVTAIIGPNGAGKSTLLKGIAGIAPITSGRVLLGGDDLTGLATESLLPRGLVFVPQEASLFPQMSVAENLRLGGWHRRADRGWLRERVEVCGELFASVRPHLKRPAGELSGGQQKLVEIARGLVAEPRLLLLDEPTAGLSPIMVGEVYAELARLKARRAVTVLLVEQNVREALAVADHVYVLAVGRNDTDGSAAEIGGRMDGIVRGWMAHKGSGVVA